MNKAARQPPVLDRSSNGRPRRSTGVKPILNLSTTSMVEAAGSWSTGSRCSSSSLCVRSSYCTWPQVKLSISLHFTRSNLKQPERKEADQHTTWLEDIEFTIILVLEPITKKFRSQQKSSCSCLLGHKANPQICHSLQNVRSPYPMNEWMLQLQENLKFEEEV